MQKTNPKTFIGGFVMDAQKKSIRPIENILEDLRKHSSEIPKLYAAKETCETRFKIQAAILHEDTSGTVAERDSQVRRHGDFLKALNEKERTLFNFETVNQKLKLCVHEVEIWRSLAATARQQDRLHL